jgi:hypothetical protein
MKINLILNGSKSTGSIASFTIANSGEHAEKKKKTLMQFLF